MRPAIVASGIVISLMNISVYCVCMSLREFKSSYFQQHRILTIHTKKMYFSAISYMVKFSRVKYEYALLASK